MGMGIVSDKEFEHESRTLNIPVPNHVIKESHNKVDENSVEPRAPELDNEMNIESARVITVEKGRGKGSLEVPNSLRQIIGEDSELNGRQSALELAGKFGISPSSVSAYSNGATSTASYDKQPNLNHINEAKERISKRARTKLIHALNHITPDKLELSKARELAGIAKDMSAVIKNMEPENPESNKQSNAPQFIFYAPQFTKEESFDVIYSRE